MSGIDGREFRDHASSLRVVCALPPVCRNSALFATGLAVLAVFCSE
jgi:hypothetical protein